MTLISTRTPLLLTLILVGIVAFAPQARAQVGVTATIEQPGPLLAQVIAQTAYETGIEPSLEALGWQLAKLALDSLTQSTVNWINSGFEGSPAFITDLEEHMSMLADTVAENFLDNLDEEIYADTGFSIRAPFQDQIARALREEFYKTTASHGFDLRYPYRDCYQGRGFSYDGWFCQSQNRANNPYGRYELARQELYSRIETAKRNRELESIWGRGVASWRGKCGPHARPQSSATTHEGTHLSQMDKSYGCKIRTPGVVIENALSSSVTSPIRQLEIADNIDEVVGALISQLMNQVLGGNGLSGASRPAGGGTSAATGFLTVNITQGQQYTRTYRTSWQRIADAADDARRACAREPENLARANATYDQASANVRRASEGLQQLEVLAAFMRGPTTVTPNEIVNQYRNALASGTIATEADARSAERQASASDPTSLYSQMTQLAASCR